METAYTIRPIGVVRADDQGFRVEILPAYRAGLVGLAEFGCLQILWWFSGCDTPACRSSLTETKPYTHGPDTLGVFATRSPERPNPIALSCAQVTYLDAENGVIGLAYLDADDGTPVLDIKPYTPSLDRVREPAVPAWCAHWPDCVEESGEFDWEAEFNF